jgi:hypothetical protein
MRLRLHSRHVRRRHPWSQHSGLHTMAYAKSSRDRPHQGVDEVGVLTVHHLQQR